MRMAEEPWYANSPDLAGFPIIVEEAIAWRQMDAFGHVNNVVYFHYFENARIEYLTRVGWFAMLKVEQLGPIVGSTRARFRKPLSYPDLIAIGARIISIESDRVTFEHRIVSREWNALAAEGEAVVVCYDYAKKSKAALPAALLERIDELERS